MTDAISGYVGWSMSRNAVAAYEDGEMPKSRWTKAAMVEAIRACCDENDLVYDPSVERMTKTELFDRFFRWSSWHHTSKFFNETDFFSVDDEAVTEAFRPMTEEELAARSVEREAAHRAVADSLRRNAERWRAEQAYQREHGYPPSSVAAFMAAHPERCHYRTAKSSGNRLVCFEHLGSRYEVPVKDVRHKTVFSFNAVDEPKRLSLKDVCDQQRAASEQLSESGDHGPSGRDEQEK